MCLALVGSKEGIFHDSETLGTNKSQPRKGRTSQANASFPQEKYSTHPYVGERAATQAESYVGVVGWLVEYLLIWFC
jgi:hypothetical protein